MSGANSKTFTQIFRDASKPAKQADPAVTLTKTVAAEVAGGYFAGLLKTTEVAQNNPELQKAVADGVAKGVKELLMSGDMRNLTTAIAILGPETARTNGLFDGIREGVEAQLVMRRRGFFTSTMYLPEIAESAVLTEAVAAGIAGAAPRLLDRGKYEAFVDTVALTSRNVWLAPSIITPEQVAQCLEALTGEESWRTRNAATLATDLLCAVGPRPALRAAISDAPVQEITRETIMHGREETFVRLLESFRGDTHATAVIAHAAGNLLTDLRTHRESLPHIAMPLAAMIERLAPVETDVVLQSVHEGLEKGIAKLVKDEDAEVYGKAISAFGSIDNLTSLFTEDATRSMVQKTLATRNMYAFTDILNGVKHVPHLAAGITPADVRTASEMVVNHPRYFSFILDAIDNNPALTAVAAEAAATYATKLRDAGDAQMFGVLVRHVNDFPPVMAAVGKAIGADQAPKRAKRKDGMAP